MTFRQIDALLLPTAPTVYTVKQVLADPVQLNSRLGTYTNFVNLLDLCGLAVPASMRDGRHAVRRDAARARQATMRCWSSIGRVLHADTALPLGALGSAAAAARAAAAGAAAQTRSRSPWSARTCPACRSTAR